MLETKSLIFNRLDKYEDIFEGITYELARHHLNWQTQPYPDVKKRAEMVFRRDSQILQEERFVSSWFGAHEEGESRAMWDLYSDLNSVAIRVDGPKFVKQIMALLSKQTGMLPTCAFLFGGIVYLPIWPFGPDLVDITQLRNDLFIGFIKDRTYSHEMEYRLLVYDQNGILKGETFITIPLPRNFRSLITVYAHPKMQAWQFKNIQALCAKYRLRKPKKSDIMLR